MHSYELFCSGGLRLVKSFIISSLVKPPPSSAGELKFFPESNRLVVRGGLSILELGGGAVVVVGGGAGPCCTLVGGDIEEIGLLGTWVGGGDNP